MHHMVNKTRGIITLYRHQRAAFAVTSKRGPAPKAPKTQSELPPGSSVGTDGDEVQKAAVVHISTFGAMEIICCCCCFSLLKNKRPFLIQRRGAEFCLTTIARHFGGDLVKSLPYLWESTVGPLRTVLQGQCIGTTVLSGEGLIWGGFYLGRV